jgi:hypothetical protein
MKSSTEWQQEITESWQQQLTSILRTGALLCDAKANLKHGEWLAMFVDGLPFKARTAQRLMKIAKDTRLTNPAHGPHLPPCWRTLYALTRLSDDQFQLALAKRSIHPEMERADAEFIAKLKLSHDGKNPANESVLNEKRKAYLEECENLSDNMRQSEVHKVTAALTRTPAQKLQRRLDKQRCADERKVKLAEEIIAMNAGKANS